jgi:ABC-type multidrug transport system ATPase subunit
VQLVCNRVGILHKGHLLKQGNVQDLLHNERVIVHMKTSEETEQAFSRLQEFRAEGTLGIRDVSRGTDTHQSHVIFVDVPTAHSSEIVALLAQQQLFPAELYHYEATLEAFFLDATTSASNKNAVVTGKP